MTNDDTLFRRTLPDGRIVDVLPLTYGRARLHIGKPDEWAYTDAW